MGSMTKASGLLLVLLSFVFIASSAKLTTVEFTVNFNVETKASSGDTYKKFIENLRPRLGVRFSHNVPVLPPQMNPPTQWFDIVLQTDTRRTTLRIRRDNLYLDGYQMENNQWWEIGILNRTHPQQPLIPGANFTGFNGDYNALEKAAGATLDSIQLGQQPLITAVNGLATTTEPRAKARFLIVVIQMTCESIRFKKISNYLAANYKLSLPPPSWMLPLMRSWGYLSDELLHMDANPLHKFQPITIDGEKIATAEEAAAILGILLATRNPGINDHGHFSLPLVEVF